MDVFTAYENASSRRITLYSCFDYSCKYPSKITFFTDQLALRTPDGTQVCQAELFFRLNKLRVGLGRCHLKKNYIVLINKFDGQIQVDTMDHFLIRLAYQIVFFFFCCDFFMILFLFGVEN